MNALRLNGPFVSGLYKIANLILLSMMWIIMCVPIFTIGASTTAMYYTVQKNIKNSRGDSWGCFWESFKQNFKQSTIVTLILLVIVGVLLTDINIINTLKSVGFLHGYSKIFFSVVLGIVILYACWAFAYIARFQDTTKNVLKNSLIMAVGHFPVTIVMALILLFTAFLVWMVHVTIAIMPPTCALMISYPLERAFRAHMSDEDKEMEDELNLEWHDDYEKKESKIDYVQEQQKRQNRIRRSKSANEAEQQSSQQSDYVRQQQEAMQERLRQQNGGGRKKRR